MFISDKEFATYLSVSRATIWRWRAEREGFPQPHHLSPACVRWKLTEVEAWVSSVLQTNEVAG